MSIQYRHARPADLEGVARVFAAAFPESIQHYFDQPPQMWVVAEPFTLCLAAEPDAFYVAEAADGRIAGYIFAPSRTSAIPWVAIRHGIIFRWFWRWVSGRYGIGLSPVRGMSVNKLDFLASARQPKVKAEARILSVAVHPDFQGQGIAKHLCQMAMERLDRIGARPVRLEVRPTNKSAVSVYSRLGFKPVGSTRDSQGEWLIMLRGATPG